MVRTIIYNEKLTAVGRKRKEIKLILWIIKLKFAAVKNAHYVFRMWTSELIKLSRLILLQNFLNDLSEVFIVRKLPYYIFKDFPGFFIHNFYLFLKLIVIGKFCNISSGKGSFFYFDGWLKLDIYSRCNFKEMSSFCKSLTHCSD